MLRLLFPMRGSRAEIDAKGLNPCASFRKIIHENALGISTRAAESGLVLLSDGRGKDEGGFAWELAFLAPLKSGCQYS
jgi:hypothetical protein